MHTAESGCEKSAAKQRKGSTLMKNFTYDISTVVHFGKGQISKLGEEIARRASRVLVVYGGGSIKRNGVYEGAAE